MFILKATSLEYTPAFQHNVKSNYLAPCQDLSRGTQQDEPKRAFSCLMSLVLPLFSLPPSLSGQREVSGILL